MPIDATQVGSPGWWLKRLASELGERRQRLDMLWRYYSEGGDLPEGAESCRPAFRAFQRKARTNVARLAVRSTRDRMVVTGFRTGADDDENGDKEARDIWNANGLRVEAGDLHTYVLAMGRGYAIIGGPAAETQGKPQVTVEDPRQVITAQHPARKRETLAALKMFTDDISGLDVAYLYLPGRVFVAYKRRVEGESQMVNGFQADSWEWNANRGGVVGEKLPYQVVPVVEFCNEDGLGEFEPHMDIIDRINKTILDRMVITAVQAFRQRAITGTLPETDEDGNDIDYSTMFAPGPGALWELPDGVDIKELGQADVTPILESVKADLRDFAAVTATPLYTIFPDAANGSAEGASTMREAHVFKVEDRINRLSDPWSRTMALAFRFAGDAERASLLAMEPLWRPAERFSLMERSQASSQAQDVPWRTRMTDIWQFSPDKVAEMETERAGDALLAGLGPEAPVNDADQA